MMEPELKSIIKAFENEKQLIQVWNFIQAEHLKNVCREPMPENIKELEQLYGVQPGSYASVIIVLIQQKQIK